MVMQILVGSSWNFAKYNQCKQITSWDKLGYTEWDQFMETIESQTKCWMQFVGHEEPLNIFKYKKGIRKSALNSPFSSRKGRSILKYYSWKSPALILKYYHCLFRPPTSWLLSGFSSGKSLPIYQLFEILTLPKNFPDPYSL